MTYKTLFAPHAISEELSSLDSLIQTAQDLECHLDIVVFGELIPFTRAYDGFNLEEYWQNYYADTVKQAEARAEEVRKLVTEAGVSVTVAVECLDSDQMDPIVQHYAMTADATVMLNRNIFKNDLLSQIFSSALMKTARPLIMLGTAGKLKSIRRAVIAWDLKPQSADALRESIPFVKLAEDVTLLMVNIKTVASGPNPGHDMATYLARHGVKVTVENYSGIGKSAAEVIAAYADSVDADLIVMGAYGHSRFREWLMGGTTRDILSLTDRTILMSH